MTPDFLQALRELAFAFRGIQEHMARILFAWELGAGIGYADRLAQIATLMAAEGFTMT